MFKTHSNETSSGDSLDLYGAYVERNTVIKIKLNTFLYKITKYQKRIMYRI